MRLQRIREIAKALVERGDVICAGVPYCASIVRWALEEQLFPGATESNGVFIVPDGVGAAHHWLRLPDGTIVDPTIAQFEHLFGHQIWPGYPDVAVVPPSSPFALRYSDWEQSAQMSGANLVDEWFFEKATRADLDGVVDGPARVAGNTLLLYGSPVARAAKSRTVLYYFPPETRPHGWEIARLVQHYRSDDAVTLEPL